MAGGPPTDDGWDLTDTLTVSPAITAFANNGDFVIKVMHRSGPLVWNLGLGKI